MTTTRYNYNDLYVHTRAAFKKMGCSQEDASTCANVLIAAELRGIPSHGIMRLKDYMLMWQKGRINAKPKVQIVHETPTTAVIDADRAFGAIAGTRAMRIAIKKAEKYGYEEIILLRILIKKWRCFKMGTILVVLLIVLVFILIRVVNSWTRHYSLSKNNIISHKMVESDFKEFE